MAPESITCSATYLAAHSGDRVLISAKTNTPSYAIVHHDGRKAASKSDHVERRMNSRVSRNMRSARSVLRASRERTMPPTMAATIP